MARVKAIQADIETLSDEDLTRLREWFAEKDAERWNEQLKRDVSDG